MAKENIQLENGYTKVANQLLEKLAKVQMGGHAWRVLMAIVRKTYGHNKKIDWIALSQISKITNLPKNRVSEALQQLRKTGIVTQNRNGNKQMLAINKDFSIPDHSLRKTGTVPEKRISTVPVDRTTKETITKEINTGSENLIHPKGKRTMAWKKNYEEASVQLDEDYQEAVEAKQPRHEPDYFAIYRLFGPTIPPRWVVNKTEIEAARRLLKKPGVEEVAKALKFHKEHKDDKYCPVITSPNTLEAKWSNLFAYQRRQNV